MIILGHQYVTVLLAKMLIWAPFTILNYHSGGGLWKNTPMASSLYSSNKIQICVFIYLLIFFQLGFTPCNPPQGIELQEKETQKDWGIQEICLERTYR